MIGSSDSNHEIKFEKDILYYTIGLYEANPMSTQEFLTKIEICLGDKIKKHREDSEDLKKMILKTPLKVLKKIAIEGYEEISISKILSSKSLPQITEKEKILIDKIFKSYLKCWKVTILDNQIESKKEI